MAKARGPKNVRTAGILLGRLGHGTDLLEGLTAICRERDIRLGRIEGIGAVRRAALSFYDQEAREYRPIELEGPLEILALTGNISVKDGDPFIHAHLTLSDASGRTYGGHLAPGTIVFACEVTIETFEGPPFERRMDKRTGLSLWPE